MTRMLSVNAALAASLCLLPLQAFAQSDSGFDVVDKPAAAAAPPTTNWFTVGAQYNSSGSTYLGRFNGAVRPGFYGLGDFHYGQRDAWDSGGTFYWDVDGRNVGLESRSFNARVGQQGTWGLTFYYDGIPYYGDRGFQSVYQTNGLLVPGVAPGSLSETFVQLLPKTGVVQSLWLPVATNSPAASMYRYNLGTQRDIFGSTGKYQWGNWGVTAGWRHEHKEGTISSSLEIGGGPGVTSTSATNAAPTAFTSGLAFFAQPIDYDTDRYDATGAYSNERMQVQLGYTYSQFTNNVGVFDAQNPFAFRPTSSFGGSPANVSGIYALPPSNSAHQVRAMLGYNFTPTTRVNANFGYGLQMQNSAYEQGIGNTNLPAQALPRTSFDGLMQNIFGNIALTARPLPKMDIRLSYTIDDRENLSPQNTYTAYPRSSTSSQVYMNLPFSYKHQILSAELGYRLAGQTKLTFSDSLEFTNRTYAVTSQVVTNRATVKVRSQIFDSLFGALAFAHEDRDAHNYNPQATYLATCGGCESEPKNLLMFFEASRTHDEIKATLDYSPTNTLTASLIGRFARDVYPSSSIGLRSNYNVSFGPDVFWQVTPAISSHAYYTYQQMYYNQSSLYAGGSGATAYYVPWNAKTTDSVHTVGFNTDWQAIPDKLKISLDYNLSYGDTAYALGEGVVAYGGAITSPTFASSITMQPLPDVKSLLSVVSLHGEYTFRPGVTLLFGYAWERFSYKDFMNGTTATQFSNALLPGTVQPNDSVHIVSAAMRLRF